MTEIKEKTERMMTVTEGSKRRERKMIKPETKRTQTTLTTEEEEVQVDHLLIIQKETDKTHLVEMMTRGIEKLRDSRKMKMVEETRAETKVIQDMEDKVQENDKPLLIFKKRNDNFLVLLKIHIQY